MESNWNELVCCSQPCLWAEATVRTSWVRHSQTSDNINPLIPRARCGTVIARHMIGVFFCYHCSHCSSLLLQMHPRSPKSTQTGRSCPCPSTEDSWTKASGSVFWKFVWKTSAVHHQLTLGFWRRTCKLPSAVSLVVAELTAADFNCSWRSWNTSRPLWWTPVCLKTEKMSLWESNPVEKWWFLCMIYWFLNIGSKKGCGVEGGNLKQQEEANISGGWDRKWTNWCKDNHLLMEQMLK